MWQLFPNNTFTMHSIMVDRNQAWRSQLSTGAAGKTLNKKLVVVAWLAVGKCECEETWTSGVQAYWGPWRFGNTCRLECIGKGAPGVRKTFAVLIFNSSCEYLARRQDHLTPDKLGLRATKLMKRWVH